MKLKQLRNITLFILFIIVILVLIFYFPFGRKAPKGAPGDYYEVLDSLNESNSSFYVLGEATLLPTEVRYVVAETIYQIPIQPRERTNFILIDASLIDEFTTLEVSRIEELYKNSCYYIIILNYGDSNHLELNHLIEVEDSNSNFLVLDYTVCGEIYYTRTVNTEYDNFNQYQYEIMYIVQRKISRHIDDDEN